MPNTNYHLFSTAIGTCGIAWHDQGIRAVQLPEASESATLLRLLRIDQTATAGQPPPAFAGTIQDIVALLQGQPRDLRGALLDTHDVPVFHQRVYSVVRAIAAGQTLSYGEVATQCGDAHAARAVGQAMARNPFPLIVPCHRVMAAHGRNGGFSANGGVATKLRLLAIEGATAASQGTLI